MYKILLGDCLETLKGLPDRSVQCCVTSPPYFGLRDYGTATWEGGDEGCDHNPQKPDGGDRQDRTLPLGRGGIYKDICKCGAIRIDSQIGLENSPEEYINKLVNVFREVKRVLKDNGTVWINLGDSFNGSGGAGGDYALGGLKEGQPKYPGRNVNNLKPKDLMMMPARVAIALQADGWYLRSEIVWHKPNPMPESVTDRPTKSHEMIYLLAKNGRYFYDNTAIQEPAAYDGRKDEMFKGATKSYDGVMPNGQPQSFAQNGHVRWLKDENGLRVRNKRDVWTVTTRSYKEAHFATFPEALIEPCILAGTSEKGECPKCGKAWVRVVENGNVPERTKRDNTLGVIPGRDTLTRLNSKEMGTIFKTFIGWQPQCECGLEPVPQTVLDPFSGAGTTGVVSIKHGRNYIGCELNKDYIILTEKRLAEVQPTLKGM